jgi:hypothetical protein
MTTEETSVDIAALVRSGALDLTKALRGAPFISFKVIATRDDIATTEGFPAVVIERATQHGITGYRWRQSGSSTAGCSPRLSEDDVLSELKEIGLIGDNQ